MTRQLKEGIIEELGPPTPENTSVGHHFLPHFAVLRPHHKTTPLRVVFAANAGKVSLNSTLMEGPSLLNDLTTLLRQFRTRKFAMTGDLRKAFNSLEIHEEDRRHLQFFWYNDQGELRVFRHKRVQFGPSCSPFLLFATLNYHLMATATDTALSLISKFYSDNLLTGTDDELHGLTYITEAIDILATGGFNLRDCRSNSSVINKKLQDIGKLNDESTMSVLGLTWDSHHDTLSFQEAQRVQRPLTKRKCLSFTAGIYDPLGLLIYATSPCMSFITKLWSQELDWDDILNPDLCEEWASLEEKAILASKTVLKRFHPFNPDKEVNLCIFSDSSEKSAAALAYLQQGHTTTLVGGKFKIFNQTKGKDITIPRKELLAMQLGAKLGASLLSTYEEMYPNMKVHLFSDSEISLHWLMSQKELDTFVHNRIQDIKNKTNGWSFYHVASKDNPSDLPTRGISPEEAEDPQLYYYGPGWLRTNNFPRQWHPKRPLPNELITLAATIETKPTDPHSIYALVDPQRFNHLEKLLRHTAILLRPFHPDKSPLTLLRLAEQLWIHDTQQKFFSQEINYLKAPRGQIPALVKTLRLFTDDKGLLRCRGRFANSTLPDQQKYPILLPTKAHFTKLLLDKTHHSNMHIGHNQLMTTVRRKFWIPKLRARCKDTIKLCVACQKVQAPAYHVPHTPDLPSNRINLTRPYRSVGVDFTGAISFIVNGNSMKGYILITSCTVTRHVHLQLVHDMSTESFIQALRYHCAIYGQMDEILCDNAKTFESASSQLEQIFNAINSQASHNFCLGRRIKFLFIPKRAPWHGAHYERLIGILKNHLRKSIGKVLLTEKELTTCLAEIGAVMNERPITEVMNDPESLEPITPNLLVFGHHLQPLPYPETTEEEFQDIDFNRPEALKDLYSKRAKIRNRFLKQFQGEYLNLLRQRHGYDNQLKNHEQEIKEGDICLIHNENPRKLWQLGRVTKVIPGTDGQVRVAELKTQSGETNRPIKKLFPIGVRHEVKDSDTLTPARQKTPPKAIAETPKRPQRTAAKRARTNIRKMLQDSEDSD